MDYTTIEESERLMQLGIDPKTADMRYEQLAKELSGPFEWKARLGSDPAIRHDLFSFRNGYVKPCWSGEALMDLIPDKITHKREEYSLLIWKDKEGFQLGYGAPNDPYNGNSGWKHPFITHKDTLKQVAYEMVEWLLRYHHLPKELMHPTRRERYKIGVDSAKEGEDYTVKTTWKDGEIIKQEKI